MAYIQYPDGTVYETENPENHSNCKRLTAQIGKAAIRQQACAALRKILKPGDTVYTVLKYVSRSGMYRRIALIAVVDGQIRNISAVAADAAGFKYCNDGSCGTGGCGMDMGFHLVYALSAALWPDGFTCAGRERCRSNDHTNGDRNYRRTHKHRDGGYALRQSWL